MPKCMGVWINDTHASVVSIADEAEEILHLGAEAGGLVDVEAEDALRAHCRNVVHAIVDPQSIFIFGTARAKLELMTQMRKTAALRHRVVGTELKGSMSDAELLARARDICGVDRG